MRTIGRKEDMSPSGELQLHRQEDGDICLKIIESDPEGELVSFASCEFTTPFSGGGGSPETWKALGELFKAMEKDHNETGSHHRKGIIVE